MFMFKLFLDIYYHHEETILSSFVNLTILIQSRIFIMFKDDNPTAILGMTANEIIKTLKDTNKIEYGANLDNVTVIFRLRDDWKVDLSIDDNKITYVGEAMTGDVLCDKYKDLDEDGRIKILGVVAATLHFMTNPTLFMK